MKTKIIYDIGTGDKNMRYPTHERTRQQIAYSPPSVYKVRRSAYTRPCHSVSTTAGYSVLAANFDRAVNFFVALAVDIFPHEAPRSA